MGRELDNHLDGRREENPHHRNRQIVLHGRYLFGATSLSVIWYIEGRYHLFPVNQWRRWLDVVEVPVRVGWRYIIVVRVRIRFYDTGATGRTLCGESARKLKPQPVGFERFGFRSSCQCHCVPACRYGSCPVLHLQTPHCLFDREDPCFLCSWGSFTLPSRGLSYV